MTNHKSLGSGGSIKIEIRLNSETRNTEVYIGGQKMKSWDQETAIINAVATSDEGRPYWFEKR